MKVQTITTPGGERLIVLPEDDFNAIVEAAEDASDLAAYERFRERLATGEEELVPVELVKRLLAGDNPIRVWREHRGLSAMELAKRAGITQPLLFDIEAGSDEVTLATLRTIAVALGVTLDDIVRS